MYLFYIDLFFSKKNLKYLYDFFFFCLLLLDLLEQIKGVFNYFLNQMKKYGYFLMLLVFVKKLKNIMLIKI